jgi:tryptophan synthase beta chain
MSDVRTRFDLQPDQIPTAWFNLVPDMVKAGMQPLPPLSPQTKEPMGPRTWRPCSPSR